MNTRFLALLLLGAAACGGGGPALPPSDVPERYNLAVPPPNARSVAEVVSDAADGDEVVVIGRVGGSERPFVDGLAAFTLIDAALLPCGEDGMDGCETPWDYCCEPPVSLRANALSVELDDGGEPLRASARGFHGLDHLDTVVVKGRVRRDEQGNARLAASGLHVQ